jgi:DNA helicase-2/ATP-dependent DNA helicase PcrA
MTKKESLMKNLTEGQTAAAYHNTGPAIVKAGPGSGKTRVLIERIRFLVEDKHLSPDAILAVTFTDKATEEMSMRLFETLGDKSKSVHVSTIHSLCKTIMEDYFTFHGFGAAFGVLDGDGQKLFILANKYRLGLSGEHGWRDLILKAAGYAGNPEDQVCLLFNTITENSIDTKMLGREIRRLGVDSEDAHALLTGHETYSALLREEKLVDFAHLQTIALKMMKDNPSVLDALRKRFSFVLVDEYQDTSPVQDELISLIVAGHDNIFVVGDENQSIYGFRGADVTNFLRFSERYPGSITYLLDINFRSAKNIVDTANKLLESKIKEKLKAHRGKGNEIIVITGENRRETARNAVIFLKKRIDEGRLSIGDAAFLYRKKSLAGDITAALAEHGLAFVTDSDGRFLERKEIRDIINIFGYLHQSAVAEARFRDWSDWWRPDLFDNDVLSFSKETLDVLGNLPRNASLRDITSEEKAGALGIKNRHERRVMAELHILKERIEKKKVGLLDTLFELFKISRCLSSLMNNPSTENEEKLFNLAQLTRLVDGYERQFSRPSAKNLLWLLHNKTMDKGMDQVAVTCNDAARCMTVHKAKGLEFPAVIVCSLIEGDFPLVFRPKESVCGIPIPARFLKTREAEEDAHYEEELRLFYVAITRAQDLLIITVPEKINVRKARRSRLLETIGDYVTEEIDSEIKMETSYVPPRSVASLSYSAVHAYRDCPLRYKINYRYGFASPVEPMQRQGIIIHNVLQKVNWTLKDGREVTKSAIKSFIEESWIPIPGKKSDDTLKGNLLDLTLAYLAFAKKEFKEIVSIEKPFTYIDKTMIVKGKVDLVARDRAGKRVLVDFKARTRKGIEETGVEDQLSIYHYCLKDAHIERLATYTFFDNQYIAFEYDDGKAERLLSFVSDGLKAQTFPPADNPARCAKCYFKFICEELTDGGHKSIR